MRFFLIVMFALVVNGAAFAEGKDTVLVGGEKFFVPQGFTHAYTVWDESLHFTLNVHTFQPSGASSLEERRNVIAVVVSPIEGSHYAHRSFWEKIKLTEKIHDCVPDELSKNIEICAYKNGEKLALWGDSGFILRHKGQADPLLAIGCNTDRSQNPQCEAIGLYKKNVHLRYLFNIAHMKRISSIDRTIRHMLEDMQKE